jgi:signal transduction histidine kinase/CheY-like chemotaxis protein
MNKKFSLSFQSKAIIGLLLLLNLPLLITGYMVKDLTSQSVIAEKSDKLRFIVKMMEERLEPGGYAAILARDGAAGASRPEQIRILNQALQADADAIAAHSPGLGVGYYSRELDAIVAYGPFTEFGEVIGRPIAEHHPGHVVMRTGVADIKRGTMVRGNILNAMHPIVRSGKVIGYAWANESESDIADQFSAIFRNLLLVMTACLVLTAALVILLSRRALRDIGRIIEGVRVMRFNLAHRIAIEGGEFGEVAKSINEMAETIEKSGEERARALTVLQNVINNVDAAIHLCDPTTKKLVYANKYLCKLHNTDDMQDKICYEALFGRSEPCKPCFQEQLLDENGLPILSPIRSERHNDILNRDFLVTARMVRWPDERLLYMEVATDITDRNALVAAEAANRAQREFLARMSHEIRTPMNGVLGMTHLAMRDNPPPRQMEYLKKIQSSAALLLGIINDILDFSRIEAGKLTIEKRAFELRMVIENIRELILPQTQAKGLDFSVNIDEAIPARAIGDELRLSQVLLNLLGNAAKFTQSGFIALDVRANRLENGAFILHFSISDSGIGMTEEQKNALFKPFSQADSSTSRKFGGSGLGLSISKALVELMGGEIQVETEPGRGSVFSFWAPVEPCAASPAHNSEPRRIWETARYDGLAFLLVEDTPINQEIAKAMLEETGARVDTANNGEEALQAFSHKDYDLIVMDVRMPLMDGLEATRRIRASDKADAATVPIIAMTADAMEEDRKASKDAGMNAHVTKPLDARKLTMTLYQVLRSDEADSPCAAPGAERQDL